MAARKQYPLRIDPELWAELEAWAANELRSVNGQIEYLLRQAVIRRRGARVVDRKTTEAEVREDADT
jgi:hypothetical protein